MTTAIAKIDFSKEQLAVIEKQFFPAGASQTEQQYCFSVARELGLNPITREIHFVPRRQKVGDKWVTRVEPMVGRDGFLSIAHRSGQLAGIETSVSIRDVPQLVNGTWGYRPDLVAECTVWRKDSDKPFTVQVAYSEYVQRNNEGQPTSFWNSKKITMISKVAESQTLRKAFNIHGVYSPEEMDGGFETASGEFLPPVFEAEVCRPEPERGRLSVVPPPQAPPTSHPVVDDDDWPVGPGPADPTSPPPPGEDGVVGEIIALLEGKRIPYEVNEEHGFISAKSYNHKELLKQSGFRWSPEIRAWVFPFEGEPS